MSPMMLKTFRAGAWLALCPLLLAGCPADDERPAGDAAGVMDLTPPVDSGPPPPDGTFPAACPYVDRLRDRALSGIEGLAREQTLIGTPPGYALVSRTKDLKGWQLTRLGYQGEAVGKAAVLWASAGGYEPPSLVFVPDKQTVDGGQLAGAWRTVPSGKTSGGGECRLALRDLAYGSEVAPFRVGNVGATSGALPDVHACHVAALGAGLLAVWSTRLADGSMALFGQRLDLSGKALGKRLTLGAGAKAKLMLTGVSVAWTGTAAVVVHFDENNAPALTRVETSGSFKRYKLPTTLGSKLPVMRWTGRALHLTGDDWIAAITDQGKLLAGPVSMGKEARYLQTTALGSATVISYLENLGASSTQASHYLVAALISDDLKWVSARAGVGNERTYNPFILAGSGDGKGAAVLHFENGPRLATLGCATTRPGPPGPKACPGQSPLVPMADGCAGEVCHALIRLDYLTLGLKGYALASGPYKATNKAAGMTVAGAFLKAKLGWTAPKVDSGVGYPQPEWTRTAASLHLYRLSMGDPAGFAMVSALTGQMVAAGGIVWAGKGSYWQPTTWNGTSKLACGKATATLASPAYLSSGACSGWAPASKYKAKDALDLALRLNLAHGFCASGGVEAYVMLYTPQTGLCNPMVAEYLVVLSKRKK